MSYIGRPRIHLAPMRERILAELAIRPYASAKLIAQRVGCTGRYVRMVRRKALAKEINKKIRKQNENSDQNCGSNFRSLILPPHHWKHTFHLA